MIFEDVTIQDCQREALLETQIVVTQRKIDRLFKQIETKEEIAQGLMSPWFCEHYDSEVGTRYQEIALLEGAVRAAKLELDRLADKRYADKARRLAALALIEEAQLGKKTAAGTTPASAPSSDPGQKQQAMLFGPGEPPAAPPKSTPQSVTIDQKAEDDIARAFEICSREIPPPDPTPATATPAAAASTHAAPLTRPTLSRTVTAPEVAGSAGQAEMASDDAGPADEEESASAEGPATSTAAPATADAKDSANDPATPAGTAPLDGAGRERAEGDGPSGMN